jgi:hypothetical protein
MGRTSSSTSVMRDWRYSSRERWNSSRSLRLTGTAGVSDARLIQYHEHTLENLAKLLDGQQPSALHLTTLVLVAAEPAPE